VETAAAPGGAAGARIVVADDDPDILFLVARVLEREGHEVLRASSGEEALELARASAPDLLLLDVSMPGMDGYAVCRELQRLGAAAPPVIFLTAHAHTSARVTGLDAGAVDYVTKPFEPAELRARVRAALRTKTAKDVLVEEAARDGLTGLLNRAQFPHRVAELVSGARRHRRPLACLMIDLDHFKSVNDAHGHAAGDAVLTEVARRIEAHCRTEDVLIRYGGEEFLALLPDTDAEGAASVAEKLRQALEADPVMFAPDGADEVEIPVQASIGVAWWESDMIDGALLVSAADGALYRAKELGRNRVELAAS